MNTRSEIEKKIMAAAMDEFYEVSFDEATMRSISKRADFSSATVYKYFKSKYKLALDLGSQIIEKYNAEIYLHLKSIEGTRNKIRKIAWYHFHHFQENEKEAWICYITLGGAYYRQTHQIQSFIAIQSEIVEQILWQGQAAGEIRKDINVPMARAMFIGSLRDIVTRWLRKKKAGDDVNLEYYFEPLIDLFLNCIEVKQQPTITHSCPFDSSSLTTADHKTRANRKIERA